MKRIVTVTGKVLHEISEARAVDGQYSLRLKARGSFQCTLLLLQLAKTELLTVYAACRIKPFVLQNSSADYKQLLYGDQRFCLLYMRIFTGVAQLYLILGVHVSPT